MEEIEELGTIPAPYGKEIRMQQVTYDNGFKLLRMHIKEGKRFTTMDIDPVTAANWGKMFTEWSRNNTISDAE
ncbi:MAG: hypothetical protein OEZ58_11180 [Gammaproteobacteria bacterium]|nr:hypothetical protein [Gammaproteobacteria bacterium]MDH5729545.1 hypothetical protein [Gammaproteobacteria bacterium]